ncbi:hypothetical protein I7X12_19385 [Halosimplex litoreum]|uniref:DUF7982 domain-containing protein n=1 Tax=Halosimplex litoreum TaxID=1198301 RepID=A0A7T3FY44_9EURY|nr:hypothetical protein [Halosimplex litoreum]QPV62853.1 hypothetical protein I7X12_19385 [Halosimplex litoreum]
MVAVDDAVHVAAGGRRRDRVGRRAPATAFALVGVALLAGGVALPDWDTLLFVWGGTALFVALFVGLVAAEPTVPATVAGDIYTVAAARARPDAAAPQRYVPTESGVRFASGGEPVGVRLLAGVRTDEAAETPAARAATLVDAVVNHLELAERAAATVDESSAELTARSRLATDELYDHPVASAFAVGIVEAVDRPATVESAVTDDGLVVTCRWDGGEDVPDAAAPGEAGPAANEPRVTDEER